MVLALIIALALSLDGFGVGMSYGLKRIRIPLGPMLIIALCSAVAMAVSMLFGHLISPYLTFIPPALLGAVILIGIGCFQLIQAVKTNTRAVPAMTGLAAADTDAYKTVLKINLDIFGLVVQILKTPDKADMDGSGSICYKEGLLLGFALSLDTFASGMAATMAGVPVYVIGLVALTQIFMIGLGQYFTGKMPSAFLNRAKFLPGMVLVIIGSLKIIRGAA